ncbi:MAG: hypothetical protein IIY89_02450 [Clostridia bacterium]|nr:hypothetical protein [Clostridia bacterium]
MKEPTVSTFRLVLIKYLFIFFLIAYLLTYLTGNMEGLPTVKETFEFIFHVLSRLIDLIRMIAKIISSE